jgi:cytosine/creatinine deaminase
VGSLLIRNARVPACMVSGDMRGQIAPGGDLVSTDIMIADGRIAGFSLPESVQPDKAIDLDQGMVLPGFVDCHTHLDKGHIWPRQPNPDGSFMGALTSVGADREANWSARDVAARMDFALRAAHAHGTVAIRTHLDSIGAQIAISWPVFAEMRETWKNRITLQATPLFGIERVLEAGHMQEIVAAVNRHGSGILGAVAYPIPELGHALDLLFQMATANGFDLDFHVDESSDAGVRALERIAEAAIRNRFKGKILCGHCCTLALQTPEDEAAIIAMLVEAGIAIVSLPMCNMYLQHRTTGGGKTPRWRGVTSLHELKAAGVPVMVASDNTRDPFYAYGDLDMLETYREATRIAHFDHPVGDWPQTMARTPADAMRLGPEAGRIAAGASADLVLFKARAWTELLSRPQADRMVIREGLIIDRTLPDYRELDHVFEGTRP